MKTEHSNPGTVAKSLTTTAFCIACLLAAPSCSDFIDVGPPETELTRDQVFIDDTSAEAAMVAVYVHANGDHFAGGGPRSDLAYVTGKSADEIGPDADQNGIQLYENELTPDNNRILTLWVGAYESIYRINAILEGLSAPSGVSDGKRKQLEGEAKFMRAFNYFYLVNLFGDVPLVTSTDYRVNATLPRSPVQSIYDFILNDLHQSLALLPDNFSLWNNLRIRPAKAAATALLSRVHLFLGNWLLAEQHASDVINQSAVFSLEPSLLSVFLMNNKEAIWQFYTIQANINSRHGVVANNLSNTVPLTDIFLGAFEENDQRRVQWVGTWPTFSYAFKYKVGTNTTLTELTTNLRLAELYLIRAEARAMQNNIAAARDDVNIIRNRAGLPDTDADTQSALMEVIKQEKRIEFFAEYGHRWLDLKRWNDIDAVLGPVKPKWQPTDALYPIPASEIHRNQNLTQNPGYTTN
jgi:hypothetical protein